MERAARLNLIFSVVPRYEGKWRGPNKMYQKRLGKMYTKTNPLKSLIDHNVIVCGGTDSDTTEINYFLAIHDAINHPTQTERISLIEALKLFTTASAYAINKENIIGKLSPGTLADVIVLGYHFLSQSLHCINPGYKFRDFVFQKSLIYFYNVILCLF